MFSELSLLAAGDTGDFTIPLNPTIDAGGPYNGDLGENIQLNGILVQNSATDVVLTWTSNYAGTFSNQNIINPTFSPDVVANDYILTLTVTSSNASAISDTASLASVYKNNAVRMDWNGSLLSSSSTNTSSDSSKLLVSGWYYINPSFAPLGSETIVYGSGATSDFSVVWRDGAQKGLAFQYNDGIGSTLMMIDSAAGLKGKWHHYIFSIDLNSTSTMHAAFDGTRVNSNDITFYATTSKNSFDFSLFTDMSISGSNTTFAPHFSDIYVNYGQWLDLSVSSNIQKFINGSGVGSTPLFLGGAGELPTATIPKFFISGTANNWNAGINSGNGANFIHSGTDFTDSNKEPVIIT